MRTLRESGLIATITLMILIGAGPLHGAEPISFDQKLMRQNQLPPDQAHAWRPGERVRAPFFSQCEAALTLTVAPFAPGGLRLFKHSDNFIIEDSAEHLAKIRDWRGTTYDGVVEVIAPVIDDANSVNTQTYRARVISLEPPELPINPTKEAIEHLHRDQAVLLIGEVVSIGRKFLRLHFHDTRYFVTLRAGLPVVEEDLNGVIKTLNRRDHPEVGDEIQLKVYASGRHLQRPDKSGSYYRIDTLRAEPRHSCYLEHPSRRRLTDYAKERVVVRRLSSMMEDHVDRARWELARITNAALQTHRLTPAESSEVERLRARSPADELALRLDTVDPGEVETLDRTFDIHLGEMTLENLYDFAYRWSQMKITIAPRSEPDEREQTVLFELLRKVGAPRSWVINIAKAAARQRLRYFELRSEVGFSPKGSDWREMINLTESLHFLGQNPSPESVNFLISTCVQLAHLEHAGWSYAGRFTKDAFSALSHQVNFAREDHSAAGVATRDIFAARARELRLALEDVKSAEDLDRPSSPSLHLLRFVLEYADAW